MLVLGFLSFDGDSCGLANNIRTETIVSQSNLITINLCHQAVSLNTCCGGGISHTAGCCICEVDLNLAAVRRGQGQFGICRINFIIVAVAQGMVVTPQEDNIGVLIQNSNQCLCITSSSAVVIVDGEVRQNEDGFLTVYSLQVCIKCINISLDKATALRGARCAEAVEDIILCNQLLADQLDLLRSCVAVGVVLVLLTIQVFMVAVYEEAFGGIHVVRTADYIHNSLNIVPITVAICTSATMVAGETHGIEGIIVLLCNSLQPLGQVVCTGTVGGCAAVVVDVGGECQIDIISGGDYGRSNGTAAFIAALVAGAAGANLFVQRNVVIVGSSKTEITGTTAAPAVAG